jgi:hypothetical protein
LKILQNKTWINSPALNSLRSSIRRRAGGGAGVDEVVTLKVIEIFEAKIKARLDEIWDEGE